MNAAAVVVRWRGGDEVDRCLESLLAQSGADLHRIVVVDSGSGDGGAERLAAAYPEIEVLALDENRSFAHAANLGAERITDEVLLLVNPDTEFEIGAVTTLVTALTNRPRTAGVTPLLVNPDGSDQHPWQLRRLPTTTRLAIGLPGRPSFSSPPTSATAVAQPAAAAWMLRRDVWQALGGFDESFAPAWWEDVDFCARLAGAVGTSGFPAAEGFVVIPEARVRHRGGSSLHELDETTFLTHYAKNLLRYAARHHPEQLALIRSGLRWSLVGRALLRPRRAKIYLDVRRAI